MGRFKPFMLRPKQSDLSTAESCLDASLWKEPNWFSLLVYVILLKSSCILCTSLPKTEQLSVVEGIKSHVTPSHRLVEHA